nr:replication protein A 70 kDa DNA-binding subunit D-like [Ipomoea batatas]
MAPMYVLVEELQKHHTSVAIRLRIVHTYNVLHSRGRDQIKSRECVFHDEETCHGEYMMKFYSETLVKDYKGCDFPRNMYRLQPFESLKTLDSNVLVDVIGRVVEIYSPLEKMINGRPSRLIDFLIEDLKGNQVKCTVWDDHVEKVMPFFRSDLLELVVVLIQMGRIKLVEKSGEVKICSSYNATKLLFNQNTVDFVEFRESLCMQQQTPLKSITSNSTFSYGTRSGGIESDPNDWYYDSCPQQNYNKKLEFNAGMNRTFTKKLRYSDRNMRQILQQHKAHKETTRTEEDIQKGTIKNSFHWNSRLEESGNAPKPFEENGSSRNVGLPTDQIVS